MCILYSYIMDFDCDCCRIDMTLKILGVPTGLPHGTHPHMHSTTNARSIEMVDLKFKFKFSEEMVANQWLVLSLLFFLFRTQFTFDLLERLWSSEGK